MAKIKFKCGCEIDVWCFLHSRAPELYEACKKGLAIAEQFEEMYGRDKNKKMTKSFYRDKRFIENILSIIEYQQRKKEGQRMN